MKTKNPNALRYTFYVTSFDGSYYVDGFKDADSAFKHCDRLRRKAGDPDDFYVVRETWRENHFIRSCPDITVRVFFEDLPEVWERTFFTTAMAADSIVRRMAANYGKVSYVEVVSRRIRNV